MLRFIKFPESYIPKFVQWLKTNGLVETYLEDTRIVHATGGGAFRYADLAMRELGTQIISHVRTLDNTRHVHMTTFDGDLVPKQNELGCALRGLTFLLNNTEREIFTYEDRRIRFCSSSRVCCNIHPPSPHNVRDSHDCWTVDSGRPRAGSSRTCW